VTDSTGPLRLRSGNGAVTARGGSRLRLERQLWLAVLRAQKDLAAGAPFGRISSKEDPKPVVGAHPSASEYAE
ncbi:hypothetical protein, partial [Streptomyces sp. NPDC007206]|uniref:hypothetical protein n=1 Tax=Streptomyces sp. NPDC007206 TaxID=3154317 RepID=UPI0033C4F3FD